MKPLFYAAVTALVCSVAVILLISCLAESKGDVKATSATEAVEISSHNTDNTVPCQAQQILDSIYDNVTLKDGRIYLIFGARGTLTVEGFNKLILEEQLGLTDGRFTFVIDPNILTVLRQNNAYGGIGYGQEWVSSIRVSIKDNETGEISTPTDLVFTFRKSSEGDEKLNPKAQYITKDPAEQTS